MTGHPHSISIWFFTGALLLIYGVMILATGIYHLFSPPAHPVVLFELHLDIWWGALLILLGGFYCWKFAPKKKG